MGFVWEKKRVMKRQGGQRERDRQKQTERQTERQT